MKLESMQDVLVEQLKDVLGAEKQLTKALPRMAKGARSPKLRLAFETHLDETEAQIQRLERVFESLGKRAQAKHSHGMEGLIKECDEALEQEGEDALVDTAIIAAAQRVAHFEIAAYGCLTEYANLMGLSKVGEILHQTLAEEKAVDKKLTQLNEMEISAEALSLGMAESGSPSRQPSSTTSRQSPPSPRGRGGARTGL